MNKLNLAEPPFLTVQGEGQKIGRPTIFIRTNICPYRCAHCDSKNTWMPKAPGYKEFLYSLDELIKEVNKFLPVKEICITGGEPLIEGNGKFLKQFIWHFHERGYDITIETSGSSWNTGIIKSPVTLWSICPHFACEMTAGVDWINYQVLNEMLMKIKPKNLELKMVLSSENDLVEGKKMLNSLTEDVFNKLIDERIPIVISPDSEANWTTDSYSPILEQNFKTTAKKIISTAEYMKNVSEVTKALMEDPFMNQFNLLILCQYHKILGVA